MSLLDPQRCAKCDNNAPGSRSAEGLCADCVDLTTNKDRVWHDDFARCPHCGECTYMHGNEFEAEFFVDGEHDFKCTECGESFTLTTHVTITFESPALIEKDEA